MIRRDMVVRGKESEVRARSPVDTAGKVTSCTSLSHFDAPEFNKVACDKPTARALRASRACGRNRGTQLLDNKHRLQDRSLARMRRG
jgi:hypothetical protein